MFGNFHMLVTLQKSGSLRYYNGDTGENVNVKLFLGRSFKYTLSLWEIRLELKRVYRVRARIEKVKFITFCRKT